MINSIAYAESQNGASFGFPIRLHEQPSSWKTAAFLGALLPALCLVGLPPAFIAGYVVSRHIDFWAFVTGSPILIAEFVFALALGAALIWILAAKVLPRIRRSRVVTISEKAVTVRQKSFLGSHEWTEPLTEFRCIAREVTPTFGGWQQRLVLHHPKAERTVALWMGESIPTHIENDFATLLRTDRATANGVNSSATAQRTTDEHMF